MGCTHSGALRAFHCRFWTDSLQNCVEFGNCSQVLRWNFFAVTSVSQFTLSLDKVEGTASNCLGCFRNGVDQILGKHFEGSLLGNLVCLLKHLLSEFVATEDWSFLEGCDVGNALEWANLLVFGEEGVIAEIHEGWHSGGSANGSDCWKDDCFHLYFLFKFWFIKPYKISSPFKLQIHQLV